MSGGRKGSSEKASGKTSDPNAPSKWIPKNEKWLRKWLANYRIACNPMEEDKFQRFVVRAVGGEDGSVTFDNLQTAHNLLIREILTYAVYSVYSVKQLPDRKVVCMSGFVQQANRMPTQQDVCHIEFFREPRFVHGEFQAKCRLVIDNLAD